MKKQIIRCCNSSRHMEGEKKQSQLNYHTNKQVWQMHLNKDGKQQEHFPKSDLKSNYLMLDVKPSSLIKKNHEQILLKILIWVLMSCS